MAAPRAKILAIDDEVGIRELLRSELTRQGYAVDTASNGEEAIEKVKIEKFDIIISDIKMPKMDGIETLAAIKKISPETEVIMITGYATVENAVRAMKEGAYDFIQKPFNLDELSILIEKALEKSELRTLLALYESSRAIFSSLKLEDLFPVMIGLLKNVIKADEVAVLMLDQQNQLYLAAASFSLMYYPYKGAFITFGERLAASGTAGDDPVVIEQPLETNQLTGTLFADSEIKSLAAYPIRMKNREFGILIVSRSGTHAQFNTTDIRNMSIFVAQIAQAIANSKLYEKLVVKISELEKAHRQLEQTKKQLILAEKMSAVGQIAAGVAQQLSIPFSAVRKQFEMFGETLPAAARPAFEKVNAEAKYCETIVDNLRHYGEYRESDAVETQVNRVVREALDLVEYDYQQSDIQLDRVLADELPALKMDENQVKQVILNLLVNAKQSFPVLGDDDRIDAPEKRVTVSTVLNGDLVEIRVRDNGPGIDTGILDKVFDPFFTTKDPNRFIGLGLSISHGIIERHRGKLSVQSSPQDGTTFIISLPVK